MAVITVGRFLSYLSDSVTTAQGPAGGAAWLVRDMNKLVPEIYDHIDIVSRNVNSDPTSVEYKTGGAGGIIVATLTLTYDLAGELKTVTRS